MKNNLIVKGKSPAPATAAISDKMMAEMAGKVPPMIHDSSRDAIDDR